MKTRKPVRLVPRLVLSATFVGVVPACVLADCSSGPGTGTNPYVADAAFGPDVLLYPDGVAADAFIPVDATAEASADAADAADEADAADAAADAADDAPDGD